VTAKKRNLRYLEIQEMGAHNAPAKFGSPVDENVSTTLQPGEFMIQVDGEEIHRDKMDYIFLGLEGGVPKFWYTVKAALEKGQKVAYITVTP
jgi:hypothetical protein